MIKYLKHNWLIHKVVREALKTQIKKYAKGKLLDIGCGDKAYAKMTKPYVTEHIGLDHGDRLHNKSKAVRKK